MIFVKQNIIIPPNYTFYELILEDSEIKGPLSTWKVDEINRKPLQMQGKSFFASISHFKVGHVVHLAKIVIREFYEKNKHLYPYKDWIWYDDYVSQKRKEQEIEAEKTLNLF